MPTKKKPSTLRRASAKFRLNKDRNDLNPGFDTVKVFVPSPLMHGGDIGISGASPVILLGYAVVQVGDLKLTSVQAQADSKVVGRMVELHPDELARLDQVAEHTGQLWHRFLAEVIGPQTGARFSVWVFQAHDHATEVELKTSAASLPSTVPASRNLLN